MFGSGTFKYPRYITLESTSCHSILTNRHALSHHCHSPQDVAFQKQENRPHEEFLSLPSLIPRHHSCSPTVSLVPCFFRTHFIHTHLLLSQQTPSPSPLSPPLLSSKPQHLSPPNTPISNKHTNKRCNHSNTERGNSGRNSGGHLRTPRSQRCWSCTSPAPWSRGPCAP